MNINIIHNQISFKAGFPTGGFSLQSNVLAPKTGINEQVISLKNRYDTVEIRGLGVADLFDKLGKSEGVSITSPGGDPAKESTQFTNEEVSATASNLSALMNENGVDICTKVIFGMSEEQLAEHFGNIGKQIDDAFSAGEITQQEYDDLNLGLEKYTEVIAGKAERHTAMWEVVKQNTQAIWTKFTSGMSAEEVDNRAEEIKETLHNQINKFIEEYCSIDRSLLNALITRVRSGESLFPEGTVQTYGRENTKGYFKNDYVPFVPVN